MCRKQPPKCCSLLAYSIAQGRKPTLLPNRRRLVELGWLWRSFLGTSMGVWLGGLVGFDTTRRGLAGVLSAFLARSRLNVSSVASPHMVSQALGSICEEQGVPISESSTSPAPLMGAVKPVTDR